LTAGRAIDQTEHVRELRNDGQIGLVIMSRLMRRLLLSALVAIYAAVCLCGPCLHALSGSDHPPGPASQAGRTHDPARSTADSADTCLLCHFVAQGQLPVATGHQLSVQVAADLALPAVSVSRPILHHLAANPRAPPARRAIAW
jgi:hypothetical protein